MVDVSQGTAPEIGAPTASARSRLSAYALPIFLVALIAVSGIVSPAFLSGSNISNMLLQVAPLGIVVIGQAFVIILRGLDLSVASVMATAAVIATGFSGQNSDVLPIVLIAVGIGVATGLVNGLLVTKRSVSPFLATLATMIVLQGFRFAYTQGAPSGNVPPLFRQIGSATWHGLPYNMMLMLVLAVVFGVLLSRSRFGREVYITGGNPTTARLLGINADRVTVIGYIISGALAAVAGLVLSGYVGIVDNWVGRGFELDSIVAAVMGGISLSGGRGGIAGGLFGAAILVVVFNAVLLFGLPVQLQIIIKGIVIVLAAAFYVRRRV
ncbi:MULTISPECIES: ABC transporter permease [unclassified Mesorhizobium]|uniref:ABC transporter permease n=1 Tax=unclassified Mesorhizobium TaxID=325217 RepID=UPI00086E2C8B|nr:MULTISPECIES: ABC transporter permease [unclassified Mesorhizobium]MBN9253549.1 ABC transporter permease [Mesorhizobium sp.]MBN9275980.1 ABC transporter permease [Mesorhizobium sp.]ODT13152.1 MAG: ATPase [Mesorhizobium sp. SCN 65-12]OJX82029.1 MAG: ATPase [Mesorhizobium sp. 65-26]